MSDGPRPWEDAITEIGRWAPDRALDIIDVLRGAGIEVRAERTGDRVAVLVPPDDVPRARRVLAPTPPPPTEEEQRPLLTERILSFARPVALVLAVLVAITLAYQGPLLGAVVVAIAVVAFASWLRGRFRRDDEEYGPGAGRR